MKKEKRKGAKAQRLPGVFASDPTPFVHSVHPVHPVHPVQTPLPCPELDIASQDGTIEEARTNLSEAVTLFFECASPEELRERAPRGIRENPRQIPDCGVGPYSSSS